MTRIELAATFYFNARLMIKTNFKKTERNLAQDGLQCWAHEVGYTQKMMFTMMKANHRISILICIQMLRSSQTIMDRFTYLNYYYCWKRMEKIQLVKLWLFVFLWEAKFRNGCHPNLDKCDSCVGCLACALLSIKIKSIRRDNSRPTMFRPTDQRGLNLSSTL